MKVVADPAVAEDAVGVAPAAAVVEPKHGVFAGDHDLGKLGHGALIRRPALGGGRGAVDGFTLVDKLHSSQGDAGI
jgi:hypothetical protein